MGTQINPKKPPSIWQDFTGIVNLLKMPCSWNPMILIETADLAATRLFWNISKPVWKQVYKTLGEGSWLHGTKQFAADSESVNSTTSEKSLSKLFTAAEWADSAAFFFWVAEMASDFTANWTSMWFKFAQCAGPRGSGGFYSNTPIGAAAGNGVWQNGFGWDDVNGTTGGMGDGYTWDAYHAPFVIYEVSGAILAGGGLQPVGVMIRTIDLDSEEVLATAQSADLPGQHTSAVLHVTDVPAIGRNRTLVNQATTAFPAPQLFATKGTEFFGDTPHG